MVKRKEEPVCWTRGEKYSESVKKDEPLNTDAPAHRDRLTPAEDEGAPDENA